VVRMARENRSWGYDHIQGALNHLGDTMSDQTRSCLRRSSRPALFGQTVRGAPAVPFMTMSAACTGWRTTPERVPW
jgi:hypothetical protein